MKDLNQGCIQERWVIRRCRRVRRPAGNQTGDGSDDGRVFYHSTTGDFCSLWTLHCL